jgi:flagellar biosynthetic protein FliO
MLAAPIELSTGYGGYLLHTALALIAVCALAALVLRLLRGRAVASRGMRVVAKLPLEPRRTIYLVACAGKYLLVGVGDGPMAVLGEVDAAEAQRIEAEEAAGQGGFIALARRALGRDK